MTQPLSETTDASINAHVEARMRYERKWAKFNADFDAKLARCIADTVKARAASARAMVGVGK